jgi:hypothetical protein
VGDHGFSRFAISESRGQSERVALSSVVVTDRNS